MGSVCKGMKKKSVVDSTVKVSYNRSGSRANTSNGREESKSHKSVSKVSVERRSFMRKAQKADTRASTNATPIECIGAIIAERQKTPKEVAFIQTTLTKNFVLARLSDQDRQAMIDKMLFITVDAGRFVYEADNIPTYFYIVHAGTLAELSQGEKISEIKRGDSFGELALINRSPRKTTVRAIKGSQLWALDRESFNQALENVNRAAYEENLAFVSSVPLFEMLNRNEIEILLTSMTELKYIAGQKIVKEGDAGDLFYVIKDGKVLCTQADIELRHMEKGAFFGEQALLYNSPRTATVTAVDPVVRCLALGREVLMAAMGDQLANVIYRNSVKVALSRSSVFGVLTEEQAEAVSMSCKFKEFGEGEVVIHANTPVGKQVWFILKGSMASSSEVIESLNILGDTALMADSDGAYPEFKSAVSGSFIGAIKREAIEQALNCDLRRLVSKNEAMNALKHVELYRYLSSSKFSALTSLLTVQSYESGELIFEAGTEADSFYMIKTGSVNVEVNGQVVRSMHALAYFGERAMLQRSVRSATVIANEHTECWVLKRDDFFSVLDDQIIKILLKKIDLQDEKVRLEDLIMVKCLGGGMFGKVYLTQHRDKKTHYALKVVEKSRVLKLDTWQSLLLERDILLQLDHILVMKLVKTMKDDRFVYFLMEYVQGKDFFDVIRDLGLLNDQDAKFYISCLLLILEYLQEKKIVYRDLKPENIMIDEEGYPKLIDFGTAKMVESRTYTIIGTPHYMAPEVISGKGYNQSADLWSLGVILYELLCGSVPFGEEDDDPYEVYHKILSDRLLYPAFIGNKLRCKSLIETLLNRNPALRSGGRIQRLKMHPWYAGVVWDDLLVKRVVSPYQPRLSVTNKPKSMEPLQKQIEEDMQLSPLESITQHAKVVAPSDWDREF